FSPARRSKSSTCLATAASRNTDTSSSVTDLPGSPGSPFAPSRPSFPAGGGFSVRYASTSSPTSCLIPSEASSSFTTSDTSISTGGAGSPGSRCRASSSSMRLTSGAVASLTMAAIAFPNSTGSSMDSLSGRLQRLVLPKFRGQAPHLFTPCGRLLLRGNQAGRVREHRVDLLAGDERERHLDQGEGSVRVELPLGHRKDDALQRCRLGAVQRLLLNAALGCRHSGIARARGLRHDAVQAHLIQREVLLLHVDRVATFKRREVEPTPALVRGFDATANQLGRHVSLLAFVHAEQRL